MARGETMRGQGRKRSLAAKLQAGATMRGSAVASPAKPRSLGVTRGEAPSKIGGGDSAMPFVQTKGTRANHSYAVKRGKSGLAVRVYDNGDTALAHGQAPKVVGSAKSVSKTPALKQAQQDTAVGNVANIAKNYVSLLAKQRKGRVSVNRAGRATKKRVSTGGYAAP